MVLATRSKLDLSSLSVAILFNPTGTYVKNGFLKVRVDVYPSPFDSIYPHYCVREDISGWVLNPCLCHSIIVPETVTRSALEDYLRAIFSKDTLASLMHYLGLPDAIHYISPLMREKAALSRQPVKTRDISDLIGSVNLALASTVLGVAGDGKVLNIARQSITMGAGTADYDAFSTLNGLTGVDLSSPASDAGIVDTYEVWLYAAGSSGKLGAFYGTAPAFTCRDFESVGEISSGSRQTFSGLSITVSSGDYAGLYLASGSIERKSWGGSGVYRLSGDHTGDGEKTYSQQYADDLWALLATGAEAATGRSWAQK